MAVTATIMVNTPNARFGEHSSLHAYEPWASYELILAMAAVDHAEEAAEREITPEQVK